jgi:hypothetical protein
LISGAISNVLFRKINMLRSPSIAISIGLSLIANGLLAADWTQFRGPAGSGVSEDKNLPEKWSDTENLVWKTELPGPGASSTITLDGRVYVTCYSGYGVSGQSGGELDDLRLHVVCLDKTSGEIVWNKTLQPRLPESDRVRDHGYAAPTPVTDGKHLYVFFGKSGVFCFDLDGNQQWNTEVGSGLSGWGCGTSPVLYKNLVIVNASVESGSLVAIDKNSGEEVWRSGGMKASWNTPLLVNLPDGKQELVVSVQGKILGFDPQSGKQLWNCQGIPDYVCPSVVARDGIVYVIGGRRSLAIAVKAGGEGDVTDTHKLWETTAGANVCSPAIHGDYLYWVSDRNTVAYCLRLEDGEIIYQKRFPKQPYASSVVGDGKIYIVTRRSGTYVLVAEPEYRELAHNELDDNSTFNASPAISGGQLFLRSEKYIFCIGKTK